MGSQVRPIRLTTAARRDLLAIYDFVYQRELSVRVARYVVAGITEFIETRLQPFPRRARTISTSRAGVTRHAVTKWSWQIAYDVHDEPPQIRVVAIVDGRRDPAAIEAILAARE